MKTASYLMSHDFQNIISSPPQKHRDWGCMSCAKNDLPSFAWIHHWIVHHTHLKTPQIMSFIHLCKSKSNRYKLPMVFISSRTLRSPWNWPRETIMPQPITRAGTWSSQYFIQYHTMKYLQPSNPWAKLLCKRHQTPLYLWYGTCWNPRLLSRSHQV